MVDDADRFQHLNPAWERTLGYAVAELRGQPWIEYVHPEDRISSLEEAARIRAGVPTQEFENRYRRKQGGYRRLCWRSVPCPGAGDLCAIARDVTDTRETERALREREHRLRAIYDEAVIGIAYAGVRGELLDSNPALQRMLGYTRAELRRMRAPDLIHPADRCENLGLLRELLDGKRTQFRVEKRFLRKDGSVVWGYVIGSLVRDAGGSPLYVVGMVEDITPRKQFEEALHQSEEQLRQMQRMEAVGRLAGGIAHDFNNMLAVISGYSELLLQIAGPDSALAPGLEEIRRAAERSASLTRQLLAFSRKQVLDPQVLDLRAIVGDMERLLRRLIGEDIQFLIRLPEELGRVSADAGQIEQVVMNLVVNARDAMPEGGTITISAADVDADAANARPTAVPAGEYVRLTVRDTGCGIDPLILPHVLEPFFTTKEHGRGTGLGLSTVFGIVQQSGGHLHIETEPGRGTTFHVYLPRVSAAVTRQQARAEDSPSGSETILLVEDEDMVRGLAREVLGGLGYEVLEAASAAEALRLFAAYRGPIHLLLTDVIMPGESGRELAERLVESRPGLKVLYMSGYAEDAVLRHGVSAQHGRVLQKPFTPALLARRVRDALGPAQGTGAAE